MDGQRTVVATLATLAGEVEREAVRRPGADRRRRRSSPAARRSPGSSGARCTAAASSSPAPAPRRAAWPRPCALLGAEVVELPAIRIEPRLEAPEVRAAAASIGEYALVCLTSPNGVRLLFEALAAAGLDARALAGATVAAIGPGTVRRARPRRDRRRRRPGALRRRGAGRGARRTRGRRASGSSSPAPRTPAT